MKRNVRKSIAALGVTSLLVVGVASAQEATETPDGTTPNATTEVTPEGRGGRSSFFADLILEYTGLDTTALRTAIANGSTLAELIEANGMSVDDFIAAVLAEYDAQAVEARTSFEERLTAALSGEGNLRFGFGFDGGRGGFDGGRGGFDGGRGGFGGGRGEGGMGPGRGNGGGLRGGVPGSQTPAPEVTEEAPAEGTST